MKAILSTLFYAVAGGIMLPTSAQCQAPASTATVVIYRPYKFFGWGMNYGIYQGEQEVCRLSNRRYLVLTVPAGLVQLRTHAVGLNWPRPERSLRFQAQAGETYFLQTNALFWRGALDLALVPSAFAESNLKRIPKPAACSEPYVVGKL